MNVHDTVRAIAKNLSGLSDRFDTYTIDTPQQHGASIVGLGGAQLFIRTEGGRLIIAGVHPDPFNSGRGAKTGKITVAADRDVRAIAREIVRRVLPEYLPELARVQEAVRQALQDEQTLAEARKILLSHQLIETYGTSGDLLMSLPGPAMHHIQFRLNHDGSRVDITQGHLPTDVFLALAQAAKRAVS